MRPKKFYHKLISRKSKYYKFIVKFLKQNNIRYRIKWNSLTWGGHAISDKGRVYLRVAEDVGGGVDEVNGGDIKCVQPISIQKFLSLSFHEASHILNAREGKFKEYHTMSRRLTRQVLKDWIRTGVRAEKYTDWRASQLLKKHFPGIPYFPGYDVNGVKRFKKYHIAAWKTDLINMEKKSSKK